ncbi:Lrp/AsnC family transcriptional regulator [Dongia sp.]|uniref:Lrp/AsnC family transcriptional regulator n=1 Tax=Dongia sp. TaxID=1977262 RepID=UPI0035B076BA
MGDLDAMDVKMLRVLQRDGRISTTDLAAEIGLSPTPCARRLKRLEDEGYIRGYHARLDPKKVGCGLQAFVQVRLGDHTETVVAEFQAALLRRPEVVACYAVTGSSDFLIHVMTADLDSLSDFTTRALLRLPGIRDTQSSIVLSVVKAESAVPLSG